MFANVSEAAASMCVTEGNRGPCVFPFKYLGVEYNECIPPSLHDGLLGGNGTGPWGAIQC